MLKDMIENKLIEARGIVGFYPANTVNKDDIEIYDPEDESKSIGTFYTLRQ